MLKGLVPHIVDTLIAERAPGLTGSALWPLVRPPLHALLGYDKARRMIDAITDLGGRDALEHVSRLLALGGLNPGPREPARKRPRWSSSPTTPPASPTAWRCTTP
jgi:hypothetical protein